MIARIDERRRIARFVHRAITADPYANAAQLGIGQPSWGPENLIDIARIAKRIRIMPRMN